MENTVYFGYYRMDARDYDLEKKKGYLNVFIDSMNPTDPEKNAALLEHMGKDGCMVWLGVYQMVVAAHAPIRFFDDWKDRLNKMMSYLEMRGVLPHLLGFYLDEPFLAGFSKEDYVSLTRYLRETWPQHRTVPHFPVSCSTHSINLSRDTTTRPSIHSAGNPSFLMSSYADEREMPSACSRSVAFSISGRSSKFWQVHFFMVCLLCFYINFEKEKVSIKTRQSMAPHIILILTRMYPYSPMGGWLTCE